MKTHELLAAGTLLSAALSAGPLSAAGTGGWLDPQFGPYAGHFRTDDETHFDTAESLEVDSQGRILVAMRLLGVNPSFPNELYPVVLRLSAGGRPDTSFGVNGVWIEPLYPASPLTGVEVGVDSSDRPIVGYTVDWIGVDDPDFAIRRLTSSGGTDAFASAAFNLTPGLGAIDDLLDDIVVAADDRVIAVGGAAYNDTGDVDVAIAVWKLDAFDDYVLDTTFNSSGKKTVPFDLVTGGADQGWAVALDGSKIVVAGQAENASGKADLAVCRLDSTGALDSTFSGDGRATFFYQPLLEPAYQYNSATGVTPVSSGGLIVSGVAQSTPSDKRRFATLRLTNGGVEDLTWGVLGWSVPTLSFPGLPFDQADSIARGVAALSDGGALVVGRVRPDSSSDQARGVAIRYTPQGAFDSAFSTDGIEFYHLEPASATDKETFFTDVRLVGGGALALVSSGMRRVTAGGDSTSDWDAAVARIVVVDSTIFADGFESGNTSAW